MRRCSLQIALGETHVDAMLGSIPNLLTVADGRFIQARPRWLQFTINESHQVAGRCPAGAGASRGWRYVQTSDVVLRPRKPVRDQVSRTRE
jgi:hypothetical protein